MARNKNPQLRSFTGFRVVWRTGPGQMGSAVYYGTPNPVVSTDGTKQWDNPELLATCQIIWYWTGVEAQANFDWHVVAYSGEIRNCAGPGTRPTGELDDSFEDSSYDPYANYSSGDTTCSAVSPVSGGATWEGPGGSICSYQWIIIEVSHDGGRTWQEYWSGWAPVCG